jgi:hypothetical protein
MWLRITYDASMTIIDAEAASDAHPYPGFCGEVTSDYRAMIGWSMRPGFSAKVRESFGGTQGCTHLTDLISLLATTAYQNLAGQLPPNPGKKAVPTRWVPCAGEQCAGRRRVLPEVVPGRCPG